MEPYDMDHIRVKLHIKKPHIGLELTFLKNDTICGHCSA